jgi:hypothetical protein
MTDLIRPSTDRKVLFFPKQKNTYGLLEGLPEYGGTCPGATEGKHGCQSVKEGRKLPICYVTNSRARYPSIDAILKHNTYILVGKKPDLDERITMMCLEVERFLNELNWYNNKELKKDAKHRPVEPFYRWHWAGDIPDEEYAMAMAATMGNYPKVNFWGYTRSLDFVPILDTIENMKLYLSMDPENDEEVLRVFSRRRKKTGSNLSLAWMGVERPSISDTRFVSCPVDTGAMDLMQACKRCRLCFRGKDVFFNTDKGARQKRTRARKDRAPQPID